VKQNLRNSLLGAFLGGAVALAAASSPLVRAGGAFQVNNANAAAKLVGKVRLVHGKYLLTDEAQKMTVELRGTNLAKMVGQRVQVVGSAVQGQAAAGASQIIQVATITAVKAGSAAAGTAAAAGAGAHISGTAAAVVVGVAATGATVGGLAAAGTIGGGGEDSSTVSR
jgi:hypothetical protein